MGKTRGRHVYKYIYRQSSFSACCLFDTVTCDCRNSHLWSRQAEACQHLERQFAPYCIGIKHKYTNTYSDLNAPHWIALISFFYMDIKQWVKKKKIRFLNAQKTGRMYSVVAARVMEKYCKRSHGAPLFKKKKKKGTVSVFFLCSSAFDHLCKKKKR